LRRACQFKKSAKSTVELGAVPRGRRLAAEIARH